MPLIDLGSYVTTGEEFKSHWTDVDAARVAAGGTALVLADGSALADLTAAVAAAATAITAGEDFENAISLAITNRDNRRVTLRERVIEFREAAEYRLKGSGYVRALPDTPHPNASEQKFLKALDDMASLWVRINADATLPNFTPPLVLRETFPLALFQTEVAALRVNYKTLTDAENDARIARGQRDVLLTPLRDRFVMYRAAILVEYGAMHPFTTTLPDVYVQPGSTPSPVPLTGTWNPTTAQAEFNWPASDDPNLDEYEMRMSPGPTYDAATATVIGHIPAGTTTFATSEGLASSGDVASFKLFVKLTTGHEAGSNTVTITRP